MNRVIKFRAWHTEAKTMLQVGDNFGTKTGLSCCRYLEQGQPVILMQFTGLYDKDYNEIYESDILRGVSANPFSLGDENNYEVIWGRDSWHIKGTYMSLQDIFNYCNDNIIVIGNIYENPYLISK